MRTFLLLFLFTLNNFRRSGVLILHVFASWLTYGLAHNTAQK